MTEFKNSIVQPKHTVEQCHYSVKMIDKSTLCLSGWGRKPELSCGRKVVFPERLLPTWHGSIAGAHVHSTGQYFKTLFTSWNTENILKFGGKIKSSLGQTGEAASLWGAVQEPCLLQTLSTSCRLRGLGSGHAGSQDRQGPQPKRGGLRLEAADQLTWVNNQGGSSWHPEPLENLKLLWEVVLNSYSL